MLRFDLPAGSYATVVLREYMKLEEGEEPEKPVDHEAKSIT